MRTTSNEGEKPTVGPHGGSGLVAIRELSEVHRRQVLAKEFLLTMLGNADIDLSYVQNHPAKTVETAFALADEFIKQSKQVQE